MPRSVWQIGSGGGRQAEAELLLPDGSAHPVVWLTSPERRMTRRKTLRKQALINTLEALRAGNRLREPEKLASFVLGTCRMTVLDLRRGTQRKERLLEQFGADLSLRRRFSRPFAGSLDSCAAHPLCAESERTRTGRRRHDFLRRADQRGCRQFPGRFRSQCKGDSASGDSSATRLHGGCGVNCLNPIDAAVLADYWLAALAKPEEEAVEEHLFDCEECGARLREAIAVVEGVRKLAREGSLRMR